MSIKRFCFYILLILNFMMFGCAAPREAMRTDQGQGKAGVYHKVMPKETLWRIAKAYDIPVEDLARANNIPDAAHIQENQLIFIPQVQEQKQTVSSSEAFGDDDFKWPIKGKIISFFGDARSSWVNNGIDIKSDAGQKIFPARGGEIVFADYLSGYGQTVIIDHGEGYQTVYGRTASVLVSVGEYVTLQTPIAVVGGDDAVTFLHFEVRKDSIPKNPLHFLP
ncbi:MAG: peptidoglycan DD-metalloendopeptidase family protein [Candidatus Omnitrophota bacterium]